eukprot:COSAG02_NODE_246_length_27291_cov_105.654200_14_plen_223_part_00
MARVDHGPVICAITQAWRLCSKQRRNALCGAAKILFRHELVRATVLPVLLRTVVPPDSLIIGHLHFPLWGSNRGRSDASGRLLLMPGADCSKGDCLPELRDDGPGTGCNSRSPEFFRTLQSGPLTSAVRCSSELWEFSPAVNRWHMLAPRGPDDRCGVISYKLHAQSNASERYELLGGWVSAKNTSMATCAHGGRHFVSTAADFAAANFSYAIELVPNDTRY